MKIIELSSKDLPCRKKLTIGDKTFLLDLKYRAYDDRITADLYDEFENELGVGEKLVYGVPLFYYMLLDKSGNYNNKFPDSFIIPLSLDNKETPVNFTNLGTSVFLALIDRDE